MLGYICACPTLLQFTIDAKKLVEDKLLETCSFYGKWEVAAISSHRQNAWNKKSKWKEGYVLGAIWAGNISLPKRNSSNNEEGGELRKGSFSLFIPTVEWPVDRGAYFSKLTPIFCLRELWQSVGRKS